MHTPRCGRWNSGNSAAVSVRSNGGGCRRRAAALAPRLVFVDGSFVCGPIWRVAGGLLRLQPLSGACRRKTIPRRSEYAGSSLGGGRRASGV